jgi:hypothetical protein
VQRLGDQKDMPSMLRLPCIVGTGRGNQLSSLEEKLDRTDIRTATVL